MNQPTPPKQPLEQHALNQLFLEARSYKKWLPTPLPNSLLQQLYDLTKWGPTSYNDCPLRIVFVTGSSAKQRLLPTLSKGNLKPTQEAPATAILAYDLEFWRTLPRLLPQLDLAHLYQDNPQAAQDAANRDGNLQAGYFILAARSLGLGCGPMAGFDNELVNQAFFPNSSIRSNFLCNIGYADTSKIHPRGPRLEFDEVCQIL